MNPDDIQPYAAAARKLLKGVVYHDDAVWLQVKDYEHPLREYFAMIGIEVRIDDTGGFAYLTDVANQEESLIKLPALMTRRQLSFIDTLLLILLRERYDEHEMRNVDGGILLLSGDDIIEMVNVFTGDHPDAQKNEKKIRTSIGRLTQGGFLTEKSTNKFEVRPIIRARIDAETLQTLKEKLADYVQQGHEDDAEGEDDDE